MNDSPYFTGAAPNFGPPSGMAALISQDRSSKMDTSGFQQFADVAEKYKQQQLQGKAADATVAAYPDLLTAAGVHPEQFKTLGARDKTAVVQGVIQGQAQKSAMQQMADVAAQAQERQAQAKSMQDTGTFLKSYAGDLPAGTEDTPQNRLANALKSLPPGADVGRVFPQAMNSLEKFANIGAGANGTTSFDEDPVTGQRYASRGKQMYPSGTDPKFLSSGPTVSDDDQFMFDGKKWVNKKGTEITPKDALKTYNTNQKRMGEIQSSLQMAQDPKYASILDKDALQTEMDDLKQQQSTLKPLWQPANKSIGAPAPMPLPQTKAELKAGRLYQTARGQAMWDGAKFVSP